MNLYDEVDKPELPQLLQTEDKWILSKLNTLIKEVTDNLENSNWALRCRSCTILFGMCCATGILN